MSSKQSALQAAAATAPDLSVDDKNRDEPLRKCVSLALERYFQTLGGHDCSELYDLVLAQVEPPLLEAVLEYTGGNQTRAAKMLGINRGTFRKKLKQYQLD